MGFAVPIGAWLRGKLRPMLGDLLLARDSFAAEYFEAKPLERMMSDHHRGRGEYGASLYALLMLELWHRQSRDDLRG